jgi:hypothetical protein
MAEVSVPFVAVAHVSVVSAVPEPSVAVPEPSVVVAEVSDVAVEGVPSDDAVEAASLGIESDDVGEASETDAGGSSASARAVPANRDAPSSAASTARVKATETRRRLRRSRGG